MAIFCYDLYMNLPESWRSHTLTLQGKVSLMPTEWVWQYRVQDVSEYTNLDDTNKMVNLEELWSDIKRNGLKDPLIIRVGVKNKKIRLESGNHRIQVLKIHGIELCPVTIQIVDFCGPEAKKI